MGCKTCKQKNQNGSVGDNNLSDIELIPKSFIDGEFSGNILLKIIAFAVVLLAMPLVLLVLVGQIFITFFLPKSLPKVTKKLKSGFMFIIGKYAEFKYKREMKKRQKQFWRCQPNLSTQTVNAGWAGGHSSAISTILDSISRILGA